MSNHTTPDIGGGHQAALGVVIAVELLGVLLGQRQHVHLLCVNKGGLFTLSLVRLRDVRMP